VAEIVQRRRNVAVHRAMRLFRIRQRLPRQGQRLGKLSGTLELDDFCGLGADALRQCRRHGAGTRCQRQPQQQSRLS
jgi:hypothetical protein